MIFILGVGIRIGGGFNIIDGVFHMFMEGFFVWISKGIYSFGHITLREWKRNERWRDITG